jgi:hypothetical protein
MKLQKQPNKWSCLPSAFAMAIDISVETIIEVVGHDGSEIIYPDLDEPYGRRSFHIQEMINVCMLNNTGVIPIQTNPVSYVDSEHIYSVPAIDVMDYYTELYSGVMVGLGLQGRPHAVAWDKKLVHDSNGLVYSLDKFRIETFFITTKINITES